MEQDDLSYDYLNEIVNELTPELIAPYLSQLETTSLCQSFQTA